MTRLAGLISVLAVAVAVAGCGGSSTTPARAPEQTAAAPAAKALTARQLFARTSAALSHIHSVHVAGWTVDDEGRTTLSVDIAVPGRLRARLSTAKGTLDLIAIGSDSYFRADRAFWEHSAGASAAARLAGRWVKAPAQTLGLGGLQASTRPATIGHCLIGTHLGTLRLAGRGSIRGRAALAIADQGDKPGSAPSKLYVAAAGEPLPLRAVVTGKERAGARPDRVCEETESDVKNLTRAGRLDFTRYGAPVHITAPPDAIDLSQLGGSIPGTQSS